MSYALKISVFLSFGALSLFLQAFNFFKIGSVNPNLILILFLSLLVFYKRKNFLIIGFGFFVGIVLWSYFFIPFWFEGILLIGAISFILSFIKLNFTGNKLIDLIIVVSVTTFIFSSFAWLFQLQNFGWFVAFEALYNILISIPFYFAVKWLKYNTS